MRTLYAGSHGDAWQGFMTESGNAVRLPCGMDIHIPRAAYTRDPLLRLLVLAPDGTRVADLGGGTGQVAEMLLRETEVPHVMVVDRESQVAQARKTLEELAAERWSTTVADLSQPLEIEGPFGLVTMIHVVNEMFVSDVTILFASAARLLPKGGTLFIETLHPTLIAAALGETDRTDPLVVSRDEARRRWPTVDIVTETAWVSYPAGKDPLPLPNMTHPDELLMRLAADVGLRLVETTAHQIHPIHARANRVLGRFSGVVPVMRQMTFVKD